MREGVSSDEWRSTFINTKETPVDILTKNLPAGLNRYRKVRMCLFDIYPRNDEYDKANNWSVFIPMIALMGY